MSVSVEMLETSTPSFDYTKVPPVTAAWIKDQGLTYNWVPRDHRMSLKYRTLGYRPLFWKDCSDEVQRDLSGLVVNHEMTHGEIHLSDCVLYVRSASETKFWQLEERARSRALMGKTRVDEITEGINQSTRQRGATSDIVTPVPDTNEGVESHVKGGPMEAMRADPNLAQAVREAMSKITPK